MSKFMTHESLKSKIKNKTAKVVVVGVGYVGLPVVALCAKAGFDSTGVDIVTSRINKLNRGGNPIEGKEPGLDELLASARKTGRLHFTSSADVYRGADIIVIAVETPVEKSDHKPRYKALHSALNAIAEKSQITNHKSQTNYKSSNINNKTNELMVVVESTIAPGTIDGLVRPTLERKTSRKEGNDLYVVNCPERLMPGQLIKKIKHHSRVIGAASPRVADIAKTFYRNIITHQPKHKDFQWRGELDVATNIEAEVVKTAENAYRDVQIAFANELAWICEGFGADFWHVRELIRKSPNRDVHEAGAGVGGHCIPKDSWLLLANAKNQHKNSVIAGARYLNDDAPKHVFNLIKLVAKKNNIATNEIKLAVMGYSYLQDSDDTRNSPTEELTGHLKKSKIKYRLHDPYIDDLKKKSPQSIVRGANMVVFMVAHSQYRELSIKNIAGVMVKPKIIIDGRNIFSRKDIEKVGMQYFSIGDIKINLPNKSNYSN